MQHRSWIGTVCGVVLDWPEQVLDPACSRGQCAPLVPHVPDLVPALTGLKPTLHVVPALYWLEWVPYAVCIPVWPE